MNLSHEYRCKIQNKILTNSMLIYKKNDTSWPSGVYPKDVS